MKKLFVALLVLITMLVPLMASGSKEAAKKTSVVVKEDFKVVYPVQNDGKTLTIWCPIQPPAAKHITSYNDQEVFQEISKRTGIKVNYIHPALGQEKEQLGLLIASGSLPDIIQVRGLYSGGSAGGVEDGIFLDMTDLMKTYAPDYYALVTATDMNYKLATTNDGKLTEFNILKASAPEFMRVNFLSSVIEKYGMVQMPETLDDYEALFAKMRAGGLTGTILEKNGIVDQFMWPFGITSGFCLAEDGKTVIWGQGTNEYKKYLELMYSWFQKGYIYKDFMANLTINQRNTLFTNEQIGAYVEPVDLALSQAKSVGKKSFPANYPRITKGQQIPFQTVSAETLPLVLPSQSMATVITTSSKNPELAMQYLNYFYTQEGADLANWGIEGKAYTVDANGKKQFTDYVYKNPVFPMSDIQVMVKIHLTAKLSEPDVICNPNVIANQESLSLRNMYSDDPNVDNSRVLPSFQLASEAAMEREKIMRDISTYSEEMTLKFITGATPLSGFDTYYKQLYSMGLQKAIDITQSQFDIFNSKTIKE
jgi:putative aldouronate transport system substrate-binding protein